MGFLDKAKKMAEQAQAKLDEAQGQFNASQQQTPPDAPGVEYDQHGRPIAAPQTEAAGATPPHGDPIGEHHADGAAGARRGADARPFGAARTAASRTPPARTATSPATRRRRSRAAIRSPADPPRALAAGVRARLCAMRAYEGLLTAIITPFSADGSVNEEAAAALAHHLLANGSHGLVVAGTTGEAATLTDDEQVRLVELILDAVGDEGMIVAGAGSNDTRHAVELTERMVAAGAHAVLSVTPYYNKPNRRGILRHFGEVARAAGGTPVILYNIPGRTAVNMPPDLLAELGQIDGIEAVKQANSDELQLIDGLAVLAGNDDIFGRCLDLGGAGGICVASHIVGPQMRRMYDEPEARAEIDASLRDVYSTLFLTASPTPVKAALNLLGHDAGTLRLPMVEADEAETTAVRAMLERHGLLAGVPTG